MSITSRAVRAVAYAQLVCAAAVLLVVVNSVRGQRQTGWVAFVVLAAVSAALATAGAWALSVERRANEELGRSLAAQRELSAVLEL